MNNFDEFLKEINKLQKVEVANENPYLYTDKISKKVQKALSDLDNSHNHCWAMEMYLRNKDNLDNIALNYRGTKVTYKEMFEKTFIYAKALKEMGYQKNDEIPMCITNIPSFIYLFLASSFIGAKINVVGDWFNENYLVEILNKTNSKTVFIDDISYENIKDAIKKSNIENLVCFSLTDSLKNGINPYDIIDSKFHNIENKVLDIKKDFKNTLSLDEFEALSSKYNGSVFAYTGLNDVCTITYTSGTTSPGHPKGVIQSNRSYITLSRFKESDVSGMPTMKNLKILAHIPTYTHMELSCAISDTFYCGCELCLEPFYDKDFFAYSLVINKPNFVPASTGFWGNLCKKLNFDDTFKNVKMPYLMIPTVTGEGMSPGEEKFFNMTSRKHKFGTAKLPFPLSPVTFSIGGGTTESSGIFVTLYKALQEKRLNYLIKKETLGLTPHKFCEIDVLDNNGKSCDVNEPGLLVAISPCTMMGYTDPSLNKNTYVTDSNGRKWFSLGTYSYKDKTGRIKMKGRMNSYITLNDGTIIPYYLIEDTILKDTKNIMSCCVVDVCDSLVCHIEFQPFKQQSFDKIVDSILSRIDMEFSDELKEKLYFRFRDNIESFPIDPSGKKSLSTLKNIGIDSETLSFDELKNNKHKVLKIENRF